MRHRVALALLVATCAASFVSSTSMDDYVNKKTGTESETVGEGNQEARGFGWDKVTSYVSSLLPSVKSVAAKDDALANGVKTAIAKTDEAGGGLSHVARQGDEAGGGVSNVVRQADEVGEGAKAVGKQGDEVGEGAKAVGKQGDEVDDGAKAVTKDADGAGNAVKEGSKFKKRHAAWAMGAVVTIVGGLLLWAHMKARESEKMTPLEPMSGSNLESMSG